MRYQDQLIRDTRAAVDSLFKAARAMPQDKLTWKAGDDARTALDMCAECAQVIPSTLEMLKARAMPPMDAEQMQQECAERASWSLEECERRCREECETFNAVLRDFPDEDLQKPIALPFGDREWTMADVASYPLWNMTYHLGQISFIQLLYGDKEMYF
ncbi:MAG TPA: DinB family protein [Armatimonadota bacterium]|jgi:uncharacterized damage-inducible protein DinB